MPRDIVQFVPFKNFKNNIYKLAKETLKEIPTQLTDYFLKKNIHPRPKTQAQRAKIVKQLSMKTQANPCN